jgi:hypothetical protein
MSNQKGNQFQLWGITPDNQVFAANIGEAPVMKSKPNFAMDLSISEQGTLWAVSQIPDPDGGGGKIFWSNGDGQWNEINNSAPGAVQIAGTSSENCVYRTFDGLLYGQDTSGNNNLYYNGETPVLDVDYGGGMLFGLLAEAPGKDPILQYSGYRTPPIWKPFQGDLMPGGLSVSYNGDCYGIIGDAPLYFSKDGHSTGSAGAGLSGQALQISFKNWTFVRSTDLNKEGNLVYKWVDQYGGKFVPTNIRANYIVASYYRA